MKNAGFKRKLFRVDMKKNCYSKFREKEDVLKRNNRRNVV
jgi:hypothetical protein